MIDERALEWVAGVVGSSPESVRGLRDGAAPWRLGFADRADLVLRTGDRELLDSELAGLTYAAAHRVPVPSVVAAAVDAAEPLLLTEAVDGDSTIPVDVPVDRLRRLGALAASLHAIAAPERLPLRTRPISGVDFAALRATGPLHPLMARAASELGTRFPSENHGFVHGDLWQGNVMWRGDELVAVIDWDCSGRGCAGVDLGSLRCDAALCFGPDAADIVLDGWQRQAGRAADDVAYWDAVAALSSPNDMGWFVEAIHGQGRTDLTQAMLVERRDAFLETALDRL